MNADHYGHGYTEAGEYREPENNIDEFLASDQAKAIPRARLLSLGFRYEGLTKEAEFHYDYWTQIVLGVWFEVTNEYETDGTFIKQTLEINNFDLSSRKVSNEDFLNVVKMLKDIRPQSN